MPCTFPRNDAKRPICGRTATVVFVDGPEAHPRCDTHDTYAARMTAVERGIRRVPVMADPLTLVETAA